MSDKFRVSEATTLLPFLHASLQNWTRSTIKQRLTSGCVTVNGDPVTRHDHPLNAGDAVEVGAGAKVDSGARPRLEILYQDRDLIAVNKPAGMLAVATAKENRQHALAILRYQLSRRSHSVNLWPVNRIDRDTSGVMLFATSHEVREAVMDSWETAEKIYLAVVTGTPKPAQGTINQPLRPDETLYQMHVGEHPDAKPAVTHYRTLRSVGGRSLLEVQLETGRQHQIRAHMAWLGNPVVGDERYGKAGKRMGLHALRLSINHPITRKRLTVETPAPVDFLALVKPAPRV